MLLYFLHGFWGFNGGSGGCFIVFQRDLRGVSMLFGMIPEISEGVKEFSESYNSL